MKFQRLHAWPRTPAAARALQARLASQVRLRAIPNVPLLAAGVDCAFSPDGTRIVAAVVLLDRDFRTLEQHVCWRACRFPYVPGLLSFREVPAILAALARLRGSPDVVLCDAQGLAHPRRCGLACHLGLWLDRPTIGCAKSRLCGTCVAVGVERGSTAGLFDGDERIGSVLRTRRAVRPLYVSPGHLCDVESAERVTLAWTDRYRLPEPTRRAHALVTRARGASELS